MNPSGGTSQVVEPGTGIMLGKPNTLYQENWGHKKTWRKYPGLPETNSEQFAPGK